MAEPTQTSSTFPNPPDFLWRQFTPDKTARFEEAKKAWETAHPEAASVQTVLRIPDLPDDLQHLQPPPEPADGTWRSLGGVWTLHDVLPNIEEWGMQRLEPAKANGAPPATLSADDTNRDRALNLKRLAKSALLNFLEFVGVASIDPDGISEKTDDIETILINMHHGINEYRPHQARESLIQTMQNRLDQIRAETAAVNAVTDKGKRVLEGLGSIGVPTEKEGTALGKDDGGGASLIDDADDVWEDSATWA